MREQKAIAFPTTQKESIKQHLIELGSITSFTAFNEYGITRLSHIIYELRRSENWDIESEKQTKTNRYGNTVNFAKYTLKASS